MTGILSSTIGSLNSKQTLSFINGYWGPFTNYLQNDKYNAFDINSNGDIYIASSFRTASANSVGILNKYNSSGSSIGSQGVTDTQATKSSAYSAITFDNLNNYYTASYGRNSSGGANCYIQKYNYLETLQWQKSHTGPTTAVSQQDYVSKILVDNNYNVYLIGHSYLASGYATTIVKYDFAGTLQWQKTLSNTAATAGPIKSDMSTDAAFDSNYNLYIIGHTYTLNSPATALAYIIKYDSSGTIQWQRFLSEPNPSSRPNDSFSNIKIDNFDNIYVSGYFVQSSSIRNAYLVKYDSEGTLQWQKIFGSPSVLVSPSALDIDNYGYIYVGYLNFIIKYNSEGIFQQGISFDGVYGVPTINKLKVDPKGTLYAIGSMWNYLNSVNHGTNAFLFKANPFTGHTGTWTFTASNPQRYISCSTITSITESEGSLVEFSGDLSESSGTLTIGSSAQLSGTTNVTNVLISI
jgi:hypothetical protein